MTKYSKCRHETKGLVIFEDSILTMSAYFVWAESVGVFGDRTICWDCWCENRFSYKGESASKG